MALSTLLKQKIARRRKGFIFQRVFSEFKRLSFKSQTNLALNPDS